MLSRLILRLRYRHALPFAASLLLGVLTAALPRIREAAFHEGTSMWTMGIVVAASTVFALMCGGRFRTFFMAVAVTPPFVLVLRLWIQSSIRHPAYPVKGFAEYLLYCVAAPIVVVWISAKLFDRKAST